MGFAWLGIFMIKFLNFIFNQLGAVVLLVAAGLLYFDYVEFSWTFAAVVVIILGMILIISKRLFRQKERDSKTTPQ